jgi:hypothetical protein
MFNTPLVGIDCNLHLCSTLGSHGNLHCSQMSSHTHVPTHVLMSHAYFHCCTIPLHQHSAQHKPNPTHQRGPSPGGAAARHNPLPPPCVGSTNHRTLQLQTKSIQHSIVTSTLVRGSQNDQCAAYTGIVVLFLKPTRCQTGGLICAPVTTLLRYMFP